MRTLIVYYSRTGNCRKVAQAIAAAMPADVEEIVDTKKRAGLLGYMGGGRDAMRKRPTVIEPTTKEPTQYDLVVIGTPVWAFTMTPAVRAWITRQAGKLPKVAFFCTMGGSGDTGAFKAMAELAGKDGLATLTILDKQIKSGEHMEKAVEFASRLTALGEASV